MTYAQKGGELFMQTRRIIEDITSYINQTDGLYRNWYVGIASVPRNRLFDDHRVDEARDYWIYRIADTSDLARSIETYFHELGCDGDSGGGDYSTTVVYGYRKSRGTNP